MVWGVVGRGAAEKIFWSQTNLGFECWGESFLSLEAQFPLPRMGIMIPDRSVVRLQTRCTRCLS